MPWDLEPVDAGFVETAPQRFVCTEVVRRAPAAVFAAIAADPGGWGDWYPGFDRSGCWTTAAPHGRNSRRRVRMARVTYEETIIAWEEPHLFAFRVDRCTIPLAHAFAESYRITPHDAGSVVQWVLAMDPRAPLRPFLGLGQPVLSALFARAMSNLESLLPAEAAPDRPLT